MGYYLHHKYYLKEVLEEKIENSNRGYALKKQSGKSRKNEDDKKRSLHFNNFFSYQLDFLDPGKLAATNRNEWIQHFRYGSC